MISAAEILRGVYAAWRMFIRDRSAAALFDDSNDGFRKSFFAALIVLPVYLIVILSGAQSANIEAGFLSRTLIEILTYVISWTAWPVLASVITESMGKRDAYFRYVVAFNWSKVIQSALLGILLVAISLGLLSAQQIQLAAIVLMVVGLIYHIFIARVILTAGLRAAFGFVVGEFLLMQIVVSVRGALLT